jgi:SRSO17 transposase
MTRDESIRAWIIEDTGLPRKGDHSVGVARPYCSQLGKLTTCQVVVSLPIDTLRYQ